MATKLCLIGFEISGNYQKITSFLPRPDETLHEQVVQKLKDEKQLNHLLGDFIFDSISEFDFKVLD